MWILASAWVAFFTKRKRRVKPVTNVCFRIMRLMNNQTKAKGYSSQKEEKATTKMRWLFRKLYHNWVASRKTRMRWFLKDEKQSRGNPMQKVLGPIRKVLFAKSMLRQASIREKKGPSLGKIQVKLQHQRSPYAMKFEDGSHEETERQEQCAQSRYWNIAKNVYKLKENDKTTFYSLAEEWVLPATSTKEPEER